ncbi:hypothetical protein FQN54_009894 [Arachnomyces sp. PD_36]|nr:hypothetical protein FQN54_009894 [Arachnomyces sp. PD_36]
MALQAGGGQQRRDSTSASEDSQPFPALVAEQTAELPISSDNTEEDHASTHLDDDDIEVEDDADFQSHYSVDNEVSDSSESESDEEDEDDSAPEDSTSIHHRPFNHPSTTSLHGANAFAPPFYNRPPTPLPPSPSLTSLLRPPFSTTTSRPTTPDSSDVETPNDTEAAVAKSARTATTVPRASPKVPTYEYYGFVLYLASSLAFLIYLLWSYLPSPFLHQLGIHYYPNRWWSLAIPSFLVMTIVYIYVALASYNTGYLTLPLSSIENIVDDAANIAVADSKGRLRPGGSSKMKSSAVATQPSCSQRQRNEWRDIWSVGTDAVMDIPVGGVCQVLYGQEETEENQT